MWFAMYLYRQGRVSATDILEAIERQTAERVPIGRLAMDLKMMTMKQVADVLRLQVDDDQPFGRLAVKQGFLSEQDVAVLLMEQSNRLKPLAKILVEIGAIDEKSLETEFVNARRHASNSSELAMVVANV